MGNPSQSCDHAMTSRDPVTEYLQSALCYIARPFVRPYVTRMDQSKTVAENYAIFTVQ